MKILSPAELQALLGTDVDVVDVREPDEWQRGHVPGARLVPLSLLRADLPGALPRDNVAFVCQKGGRSAQAAALAEAAGKRVVYDLGGGTDAWIAAGLPVVKPGETSSAPDAEAAEPEQKLDAVVGQNLRRERDARGWSLDDLARLAGVSRALLGQVEIGRAVPSIGIVWKIAQALDVPFAALLAQRRPRGGTVKTTRDASNKLTSADGRFTSRALFTPGQGAAEFYELLLAPHSREDAEPHRPGTRENLVVVTGRLDLKIGNETVRLEKGDAIDFAADEPHAYVNTSGEPCWMYLVMNYAPL